MARILALPNTLIRFIMKNAQKISCPTCKKPETWYAGNPFKPFCSERCKLIDLGEWANESRKIPVDSLDVDFPEDFLPDSDD